MPDLVHHDTPAVLAVSRQDAASGLDPEGGAISSRQCQAATRSITTGTGRHIVLQTGECAWA